MKKLITILLLTSALHAHATSTHMTVGVGGYQGDVHIGLGREPFTLLFGQTGNNGQITFRVDRLFFKYFIIGAFATYTTDTSFFAYNSDDYPSRTYYPQTALRGGLTFGVKIKWFYITTNISDIGIQYIVNEEKYRHRGGWTDSNLWSTGIGMVLYI